MKKNEKINAGERPKTMGKHSNFVCQQTSKLIHQEQVRQSGQRCVNWFAQKMGQMNGTDVTDVLRIGSWGEDFPAIWNISQPFLNIFTDFRQVFKSALRTNGRTDKASYRDALTHLKTRSKKTSPTGGQRCVLTFLTFCIICMINDDKYKKFNDISLS